MDRGAFLYKDFISRLDVEATPCQDSLLRDIAAFLTSDEGDIMVVNGYAGTGKTTAIAAVVAALTSLNIKCSLMAPTGRAAKVLSQYTGKPASTIHKGIYRQKSVGADGMGRFTLDYNKSRDTLFVVDEVSLIGADGPDREAAAVFGSGNLLEDLITYVRAGSDCRLILIGDSAQLPPVGLDCSPALSREYMEGFGGVRFATLTTVTRQQRESGILHNATILRKMISSEIAQGKIKLDLNGFEDIRRVSGGELIETLSDAYSKYGDDDCIVLCRSNKMAIRYNLGIRSMVEFKEDRLVRGEKLMIVKNCYQFLEDVPEMDYIANGDIARLMSIKGFEDRYGLHFAKARLLFPDYGDVEVTAKVCLDTLESETASLTAEQQNALYKGVDEDYSHISSRKKRWEAVREDPYFNALQLKYGAAVTCHKSQGGQWSCVFIDCPFWQEEQTLDDLKWLYTALTRAVSQVYLVNFNDRFFI